MKNINISIKLDIHNNDFSKVSSLTKHFDKEIISLKKEIGQNKLHNFSRDLYHTLFDRYLQKAQVLKQNNYKKESLKVLENLKLSDKKSLFVFADANNNVYLSSRNLKRHNVLTSSELNTYRILNNDILVLSESVIEKLEQNLSQ